MEIITQNYENILKEMIINNFKDIINKKEHRYDNKNKVFNYIDILSNMYKSLCELAKDTIKAVFNAIDKGFKLSLERRAKYHIKPQEQPTPETLYIMADEKFISTQNNDKKQVMVKSIVTFEGIEKNNKKR